MFDTTKGYDGDPKLLTVFDTECRGGPDCRLSQVIEGLIQFFGLCEHHALPFYGQAYVGYIAHEQIIGISKLTRLVRLFAKRFTVQDGTPEAFTNPPVWLRNAEGKTHVTRTIQGFFPSLAEPPLADLLAH